jgi:hypothetical protein
MGEEYLLAWNDHHNSIITAMSELASGTSNLFAAKIVSIIQSRAMLSGLSHAVYCTWIF